MPMPVESLTPNSPNSMIRDAISQSIEACMKEGGRKQKECAGMVYGMARKATGKKLMEGKIR